MLTRDAGTLPVTFGQEQTGVVGMLAQGLPMTRTLEAAAAVAARVQPHSRAAILLLNDERLEVAAEHNLTPEERRILAKLPAGNAVDALNKLAREFEDAQVKPLLTYSSELVGSLVVFGFGTGNDQAIRALDEICAIATLGIEQRNMAEELTYRAHHDPLTHLWNRLWMQDEIARSLDTAADNGSYTGLLQIGLDSFRLINDVLGAQAANEVVREVGARLSHALRPGLSLARGSGDEFLILLPSLAGPQAVQSMASQFLTWFEKPFKIGEHELLVRASIGAAVSGPGECDADTLQRRADVALRYAKKYHRGKTASFAPSMVVTPPERLAMEKHLRFALQKRELELFYQPQVSLKTGRLVGAEALLRWRHSSLGYISPASFIPLAEEIGIMDEIGDWVIGDVLRQLEMWQRAGMRNVRLAANVSATQFSRSDFAASVARRLRTAEIDPKHLELEVTESAVMRDFEHAVRQMRLLNSLGVCTALDDFGTGHSSLAYLQQLPVQRLKIDRMFVKGIAASDERPPLLNSIIQMGHAVGCSVIVEGIETQEQALALAAMDCEEMQGFLVSKPVPAAEFLAWSRRRNGILTLSGEATS